MKVASFASFGLSGYKKMVITSQNSFSRIIEARILCSSIFCVRVIAINRVIVSALLNSIKRKWDYTFKSNTVDY